MRPTDPTVIDVTPVSSHTSDLPPKPMEPDESRASFAWARLKRRLLAMAFVLAAVAAVVIVVSVGLLVFFLLLGVAALLMVAGFVSRALGRGPGSSVQRR